MRRAAFCGLATLALLSACDILSPSPGATEWCAANPQDVVAASASDEDGGFLATAIELGVEPQDVIRWLLDDTPTRDEHRTVLDAFVEWSTSRAGPYDRACQEAFAQDRNGAP